MLGRAAALALLAAGCQKNLADLDGIYYGGGERRVHCAVDLDSKGGVDTASLDGGLDRAARRGEIIELYAHHPGVTVPTATIEHVLAGAQERGMAFVTYADFARGTASGPGVALSFDDASVDAWAATAPLFAKYGAHVTFFVSRYKFLQDYQKAELVDLAAAGHDIEAHSVLHLRAPTYVEDHGLAAYLADEAQPSIDALVADGHDVRVFAYPFGARTDELDRALLERVAVLRSVMFTYDGVESPCPL